LHESRLTGESSNPYTQFNMNESDNTTPYKADVYDRSVIRTIPFYKTIQSEAVDLVRTLKPEVETWMDTGCGTGYMAESALRYFPKTQFILADPAEAMLKLAARRLYGLEEKRIRILPAVSSQDLSKYRNEFNPSVITAILCHHYIQRPQRIEATRACYDLLKKGGVFITFEIISPETSQGIQTGLNRWKRFQINHGRARAVVEEHLKRFNSSYFPITIKEHLTLLKETGFQTVELFWLSYLQAGIYAIK
jgi:tRNA (cmo5U34)-methyltransferase